MEMPARKLDDNEKTLVLLTLILSIIVGFLAPLIIWALKKNEMNDYSRNVVRKLLNFELTLACIGLIFLIPIIGQLLAIVGAPIVWILNIVYCILAVIKISNFEDVNFPISFNFIKN